MTPALALQIAADIAHAWWRAIPGFVIGALIFFPLGQCSGSAKATKRIEATNAVAQVEALKIDGAAKEKSSAERLQDAADVADMKERLIDAVASYPDEIPSDFRVALGCQRLRNAGTSDAKLPVACRSGGAAQARSAP